MKPWFDLESEISELYFSLRWVEIDKRCWVEIIFTQHQAIILCIEKYLTHPLQKLRFCYMPIYFSMGLPQYLRAPKHHNRIQQLTAVSHSLFRACVHVGCWVEFHQASLPELMHAGLVITDGVEKIITCWFTCNHQPPLEDQSRLLDTISVDKWNISSI